MHFVRLFWGLPALLLVCVLWLLTSQAGSQWVLDQATSRSNGLLEMGTVTDGHLLGDLRVDWLKVNTPGAEVEIDRLRLDWSPLALLRLRVQVDVLAAGDLKVNLLPTAPEPDDPDAPTTTPPSRLPIGILLRQVNFDSISVAQAEAPPVVINDLSLVASWLGERVRVRQLSLNWVDQFPLALSADARLSDTGAVLSALQVTQPLALDAEGRYGYDGEFAADLAWQNARWPLTGDAAPQASSEAGTLRIAGRPEAYTVALDADLATADKAGRAALEASGSLEHLAIARLDIEALGGRAAAAGRVQWAPALTVDIEATLDSLNPGVLAPDAPGRINGRVTAQGGLDADNPLQFSAEIVDSMLRDQPFALSATGGWDQTREQLTLQRARLSQGVTELNASGQAWPELNLKADLRSDDLSTLLPELAGTLQLDATLTGAPTLPAVSATARGRRLGWADSIDVDALNLDTRFDPDGTLALSLTLDGIDGPTALDTAALNINGTLDRHQIDLAATAPDGTAKLTLRGGADVDRQRWQGQLSALNVAARQMPAVRLVEPADLLLSADNTELGQACLHSDGEDGVRACLQAAVTPELTRADVDIETLNYALLSLFIPGDISLSGALNGQVSARLAKDAPPELDVDLRTEEGAFEIRDRAALTLFPGYIRAREGANGLSVDIDLPVSDGQVRVTAEADVGTDPLQRALRGRVDARLDDLDWLNRLTPELEETQGSVAVGLDLSGVLGKPSVAGRVALSIPSVVLPQAGITLRNTVAEVFPEANDQARIAVRTEAGDGSLQVEGDADWSGAAPTVALAITGDMAQVAELPDARVWITPDLRIALADNRLDVTGRIDVPRADITPRGGNGGGQGPTSDQIVVRDGDLPATQSAVDVHVNVLLALGENVTFKGFGLTTRFGGQLRAQQRPGQPVSGRGEIRLLGGRYKAYGQDLDIETGRLIFSGGPLTDPAIDIRAIREPRPDIEVGVTVRGRLDQPEFALFSNPAMPQGEQLSWLVLGRGMSGSSGDDDAALANAALALGLSGGDFLAQRLKGGLIDDVSIGASPGEDPDQAKLTVGRRIGSRLYISYGIGLFQPGHVFKMLYDIGRGFQLQTETGVVSGADLLYTIER